MTLRTCAIFLSLVGTAAGSEPSSFVRDVEPILTKYGCNSGACHGAQHGRGGFRLSLLAFDPAFDYDQIVRSAEGRRVVLSDPEKSILLRKPALMMDHAGGKKFTMDSTEADTILRWLEAGAPEPAKQPLRVTHLDVTPQQKVMAPGEQISILVTAHWSDGVQQDVTTTAQYDALNEGVVEVSPEGKVVVKSAGESHIMIRFSGQATVVQVTSPYERIDDYPEIPANNYIDQLLINKWRELGLTPSPECDDPTFLRRLHLDVIGTLPRPEEVEAFLKDTSPDKRERAIDAVLDRPEFVDYWTTKWGDLLRINRRALQDKGMWSFHNWVRAALRDEMPVNEFAASIITAEGSTFTEGPANFFRVGRNAEDWAESTAQVFLGVRIQCAKCHHHPFEKWSQEDYYGLTAFFTRLGTKNSEEFGIFGRETVIYLRPTGDARHPRTGQVVNPAALDAEDVEDEFDRRRKLAEWLTQEENEFFARNVVNRFWGYLMGRGLVEPLDDMRATNPVSNPALLDALAQDFVKHQFDLKHLLRTILRSRAYQLHSESSPGNVVDGTNTHFTRYTPKRVPAEVLADAIDTATGHRTKYQGLPEGTRAIQLPDPNVPSYLLDVFGRPERQIACECERGSQPNIAQALHLLNGRDLNAKLAARDGRIDTLIKNKTSPEAIVRELYLVTLAREPKPEEVTKAMGWIDNAPSPRDWAQDLLWVLLNSREFQFIR